MARGGALQGGVGDVQAGGPANKVVLADMDDVLQGGE